MSNVEKSFFKVAIDILTNYFEYWEQAENDKLFSSSKPAHPMGGPEFLLSLGGFGRISSTGNLIVGLLVDYRIC